VKSADADGVDENDDMNTLALESFEASHLSITDSAATVKQVSEPTSNTTDHQSAHKSALAASSIALATAVPSPSGTLVFSNSVAILSESVRESYLLQRSVTVQARSNLEAAQAIFDSEREKLFLLEVQLQLSSTLDSQPRVSDVSDVSDVQELSAATSSNVHASHVRALVEEKEMIALTSTDATDSAAQPVSAADDAAAEGLPDIPASAPAPARQRSDRSARSNTREAAIEAALWTHHQRPSPLLVQK
jgi:di/tripeptidase